MDDDVGSGWECAAPCRYLTFSKKEGKKEGGLAGPANSLPAIHSPPCMAWFTRLWKWTADYSDSVIERLVSFEYVHFCCNEAAAGTYTVYLALHLYV
ncbi:hypothetical protein ACLOJK_041183 [Asimina triloba]